jgi:hypothetical protein
MNLSPRLDSSRGDRRERVGVFVLEDVRAGRSKPSKKARSASGRVEERPEIKVLVA